MNTRQSHIPDSFSELDDHTLIERSLAGDATAWAALIERYERLIFSIPLRYGLSESQAADVFQDVCLILLERLDQLNNHNRLASWLGTTTRRRCWKIIQRRDAASATDPDAILDHQPSIQPHPDVMVAEWEAHTALHQALSQLGDRCRLLLQRLYFTHPTPSYAELAEELDMPVGSVGPTRARCMKKLRHLMGGKRYRVSS